MTYREQTLRDLTLELDIALLDRATARKSTELRDANERVDAIVNKINFLKALRFGLFVDEEVKNA